MITTAVLLMKKFRRRLDTLAEENTVQYTPLQVFVVGAEGPPLREHKAQIALQNKKPLESTPLRACFSR